MRKDVSTRYSDDDVELVLTVIVCAVSNLSAASFLDLIRAPTSQHPGRAAIRS